MKVIYRLILLILKKQNSIRKYFMKDAELCTFKDPNRFKNFYIIHCVKEGAEQIKPKKHPLREDEYATSVLSIQISKHDGFLKITNRYNHLVSNPDNTFSSNPDMIVPGLSLALENHFNCRVLKDVFVPEGFIFFGGQFLKVNEELMNYFIGENFYVKKGELHEIDKGQEIIIDNYIFNIKNRTFTKIIDEFPTGTLVNLLQDEFKGKSLQFSSSQKRGCKCLLADGTKLIETRGGTLIYLNLPNAREIATNFIKFERDLKYFYAPKVQHIGDNFLSFNHGIKTLHLPCLQTVGNGFLMHASELIHFSAPLLKQAGCSFLSHANLKTVLLQSLQTVGEDALIQATNVEKFSAPNLMFADVGLLLCNIGLKKFYAPKLDKLPSSWYGNNFHLYYHPHHVKILSERKDVKKFLKKASFFERLKEKIYS